LCSGTPVEKPPVLVIRLYRRRLFEPMSCRRKPQYWVETADDFWSIASARLGAAAACASVSTERACAVVVTCASASVLSAFVELSAAASAVDVPLDGMSRHLSSKLCHGLQPRPAAWLPVGARADYFWSVPSLLPQLRPSNLLVCSWGQVVDANTIRYVSQAETVEGSTTVGLDQLPDAVWPLMSSEDQNVSRGGSPCFLACRFLSLFVFASLSLSPLSVCLSCSLSFSSALLITCTCCYDLSKGIQDKDFSYSFSDSLFLISLTCTMMINGIQNLKICSRAHLPLVLICLLLLD
jgi:hypothetical protein